MDRSRRVGHPRVARAASAAARRPSPGGRPDEPSGPRDAAVAAAAIVHDLLRRDARARELDEARLDGVRLASREMAHLLNNDLAVAIGLLDLLRDRAELPDGAQDLVLALMESLESAAGHVAQFQDVKRVATRETPIGPSLDLERSRAAS